MVLSGDKMGGEKVDDFCFSIKESISSDQLKMYGKSTGYGSDILFSLFFFHWELVDYFILRCSLVYAT